MGGGARGDHRRTLVAAAGVRYKCVDFLAEVGIRVSSPLTVISRSLSSSSGRPTRGNLVLRLEQLEMTALPQHICTLCRSGI
jgi:hypothetical protein